MNEFIRFCWLFARFHAAARANELPESCGRVVELRICFGSDISASNPACFVFRAPQNAFKRRSDFARFLPDRRAWADRTPAWPR
jgi:hypothetical protein